MRDKPLSNKNDSGYYARHLQGIQRKLNKKYSLHGAHHRNLNMAIQLPILALPSGSRILDMGCGFSIWVNDVIDSLYDINGLDIQEESISFCVSKFPTRKYSLGSVYELPYKDEYFDAVVMRELIEHLLEPENVLAEVCRVLKPNGLCLLTTPNYDSILLHMIEHTYNRFFGGNCKPYLPDVHPSKFRYDSLLRLLEKYLFIRNYRTISLGITLVGFCTKLPVAS